MTMSTMALKKMKRTRRRIMIEQQQPQQPQQQRRNGDREKQGPESESVEVGDAVIVA